MVLSEAVGENLFQASLRASGRLKHFLALDYVLPTSSHCLPSVSVSVSKHALFMLDYPSSPATLSYVA